MVDFLIKNGHANGQSEIADAIGFTKSSISNIMNNRRNIPSKVYNKFSETYGMLFPQEPADTRDEIITLLRQNNKLLEDQLNLATGELRHIAVMNHSLLLTLRDAAVDLLAKSEKKSVLEVEKKLGKVTAEYYRKNRQMGSMIDSDN